MAYLVVAYPQLSAEHYNLIQNYRKVNDELYYTVVEPHFTIVFPVFDQLQIDFVTEIKNQSAAIGKFNFTLRCATVSKDTFSDYFHTFLVPDEGFSNIVKLHDHLYNGILINNRRLDIDYIPHISVGNSKDKFKCKSMADEWNSNDFCISGQITKLTIADYTPNKVSLLEEIFLK